jgi:mannose-6-phosphate isomerase
VYRLTNPWQRYAWGSADLLPALLGLRPDGRPLAEIWMGAHAAAPSSVQIDGQDVGLDDLISRAPQPMLGADVIRESGVHLPFMMKLLAVDKPLSLQVHPTREQAEEGYCREDEAGLSLTDLSRDYRDRAHKPEVLYALTAFEMLCGFRPVADVRELLEGLRVEELDPILEGLDRPDPEEALRAVLTAVLTATPQRRQSVTRAVVGSAQARRQERPAYRLLCDLARHYPDDCGIIASLLLDHLRIRPGEAVFIGAGMLHSYVRGLGVELMATSDNVVRAGLTAKHVDVREVLRLVEFAPGGPEALQPACSSGPAVFVPPVRDFALWTRALGPAVDSAAGHTAQGPPSGPRIALCFGGRCTLMCRTGRLDLRPGQAVFVPHADGPFEISGMGAVAVACSRTGLSAISGRGDDLEERSVEVSRQVERVQLGEHRSP